MENLKSPKLIVFFWCVWLIILTLLVMGFQKPLLRIPVMGMMEFQECPGFSVASAIICVLGVGVGGIIWILSRQRACTAIALGLAGLGLLALLTCFLRLGSYLAKMLTALSTEGMDLSRVIQAGGWSLLSGLVIGLIAWFLCLVQYASNRPKIKDIYEN